MSPDNNVGIVTPESLFATVDYKGNDGADKTLHVYYTVKNGQELIRGEQVLLSASFQDMDKLAIDATVGSVWMDVDSVEQWNEE